MKQGLVVTLGIGTCLFASLAFGQSREELAELYLDNARENQTIYQSTPISHIVPDFNTITYSLQGSRKAIEVTSPEKYHSKNTKLELGGYNVSPYLALSLRNIGLGFSVEAGRMSSAYKQSSGSGGAAQKSQVDYSGVGIFLFNAPLGKGSKRMRPAVVLGGRMLNAKHQMSSTKYGSDASPSSFDLQSQNYTIYSYEAGFNIDFKLFNNFGIIPWADYNHIDSRKATGIKNPPYEMRTDVQLFWHDKPRFTYGLDFSVRMMQFQVRLGGLLGLVAAYGSEVDYIVDNSVSLSFSIDQKGH